jgi:hypothetical protein
MAKRRLTDAERSTATTLLNSILKKIEKLSGGDPELLFALRRRLIVKLTHAERGTPAQRNRLKEQKYAEQKGVCPLCKGKRGKLPLKYAELDRKIARVGYTAKNTRLVHHECHTDDQRKRSIT